MACQEACGCCKGACCYESGGVIVCTQETCKDCEYLEGQFQGIGTECVSGDCPCDPPADHLACEKCVDSTPTDRCDSGQHCCDGVCQDEPCDSVSALVFGLSTNCESLAKQALQDTALGPQMVQVWRRAVGHCGIGDCLRGALELHRRTGAVCQDYSGHPVEEYVEPGVTLLRERQDKAPMVLVHAGQYACLDTLARVWRESGQTGVVFSNAGPAWYKPLTFTKRDRQALQEMLVPTPSMRLRLENERYRMPAEYRAYQFRTFDDKPPTRELIQACIDQVPNAEDVWVLASSTAVRDAIKAARPKVFVFTDAVAHTGKETGPGVLQSLLEFWLLGQAKEVRAYTVYEWVSNYAVFAAARGGVPVVGKFLRRHAGHWYATGGAGTHLKSLLERIGLTASPTCPCARHAAEMDYRGTDWCEENIGTIDGWLADEARKRKLPYVSLAGKALVRLAIKRARRCG
jgi:hypothetical protein